MIAEKLPITFDIKRIQDYFNTHVKHVEPVLQNKMFGGWSILSASGDYRDGFQIAYKYYHYNEVTGEYTFDYEGANRDLGFKWPKMHVNPTQLGTEYIAEIIQTLEKLGLQPHHARWTRIPPNCTTIWHQDEWDGTYGVRLHIPVFTNPECAYETEEGTFHMPANGSCYLVDVSRRHRAYNNGKEDRIHIIMDVIDDVGFSKHHQSDKCRKEQIHNSSWQLIRTIKKIFQRS